MTLYDFTFSKKPFTRTLRHVSFWICVLLVHTIYEATVRISLYHFPAWRATGGAMLENLLQLPLDVLFVYWVIYYLMPRYLHKKRLTWFAMLWLCSLAAAAVFSYYYSEVILLPFQRARGLSVLSSTGVVLPLSGLLLRFNMEAGIASSLRLIKIILHQKGEAELHSQELTKRIQENYFIRGEANLNYLEEALEGIHAMAQQGKCVPPDLLLHFRQLLHFVWHERNQRLIAVTKEVQSLHHYLEVHKEVRQCDYSFISSIGFGARDSKIVPYLLIPFIEPYLQREEEGERPLHTEVRVGMEGDLLKLHAQFEYDAGYVHDFGSVRYHYFWKRLRLKYPEGFRLENTVEGAQVSAYLEVSLQKVVMA